MKIKISRDALLAAMQKVSAVIPARPTLHVLANALFEADGGTLTLTGSDSAITVRTAIEAEVVEPGATTLPVKRIASLFHELSDDSVDLSVDENDIASFGTSTGSYRVYGISAADFPKLPDMSEGASSRVLDQAKLREMLRLTSYAASNDVTRTMLNAVLLSFRAGKMTAVATDSRRLAMVEQEADVDSAAEGDLVIPLKAVGEIQRMLGDGGTVEVKATAAQAAFAFSGTTVFTTLVQKQFPNYRQVIPQSEGSRVTLDREPFLTALKRLNAASVDASAVVKLELSEDRLKMSIAAEGVSEGQETLAVKYAGDPIAISFNSTYLMEPVKNLSTDELSLDVMDDVSPGVIRTSVNFVYVLMPIRM